MQYISHEFNDCLRKAGSSEEGDKMLGSAITGVSLLRNSDMLLYSHQFHCVALLNLYLEKFLKEFNCHLRFALTSLIILMFPLIPSMTVEQLCRDFLKFSDLAWKATINAKFGLSTLAPTKSHWTNYSIYFVP
ncbi:hypothetical protein AAMO2058_000457600 [Amorphochlora amoebiformis]